MKYSERLSEFLIFLQDVQLAYASAERIEKNDDYGATQDLLHSIELGEHGNDDLVKLAITLKEVRQERREAKNTRLVTTPIINWIHQNQTVIDGLRRLFQEVADTEAGLNNRSYTPRTNIVNDALNKEIKNDSQVQIIVDL